MIACKVLTGILSVETLYTYKFNTLILMSTCTVLTGIQADRIYVLYCNCRYPGRPVDGDYKDPPTPPLHALPKIPGIRREGVAQSIMGRSDRRGPAGQGTAEGLGEICSHSWEGGAREARE